MAKRRKHFSLPLPDAGLFRRFCSFTTMAPSFGIGKEKLIEPWDDPEAAALHRDWSARFYGGRSLGAELVRRGYCVMCADALGWGSRQGNGYASQQALAANLMQVGTSLAAVVAREDVQAAAYLTAHPQVDASPRRGGRASPLADFAHGRRQRWSKELRRRSAPTGCRRCRRCSCPATTFCAASRRSTCCIPPWLDSWTFPISHR